MLYEFKNPFFMTAIGGKKVEIKTVDLDVEKLNLADKLEIEANYYKGDEKINIPEMAKKISIRWNTCVLLKLFDLQYPDITWSTLDIQKITWSDATEIFYHLEAMHLDMSSRMIQKQFELLISAAESKQEDENKTEETY